MAMELGAKTTNFAAVLLLIIIILLPVAPYLASGAYDVATSDSLIYDIDYRGPETHSNNIPPPSRGGRHNFRHKIAVAHHKSNGRLRSSKHGHNNGKKLKKKIDLDKRV